MRNGKRMIASILSAVLVFGCLSGCGSKEEAKDMDTKQTELTEKTTETKPTESEQISEKSSEKSDVQEETFSIETEQKTETKKEEDMLTDTQKNSISMLNYLTVLTKEINDSSNSRLYMENAYSSLLNNTYPNAVDSRTLVELTDLLDILESYRMINVKRERLDYIYEQNKAQALRAAIPSPLGLLSAAKSCSISQLVGSLAYMAVDSYTSYTAYTEAADLEYLQSGWELDDQEDTTLHNSRSATFTYMMDMVREYNLPGDLTLYENAVNDFVSWKNNTNIIQRIQFLESNQSIYAAFGPYWLTLAQSYYENNDYSKCLSAMEQYLNLDTRIFRKDYDYADTLPFVIAAASEVLKDGEYVEKASFYAEQILENCDQSEWSLRYLAAQTYIDLYGKTKDKGYLQQAYDIALNSVNCLVEEQRKMNSTYLNEIKKESITEEAKEKTEDAKKLKEEIEDYNKQLEEERKTALPPVYEALQINCDLLFALADELGISEDEKTKIDGILHENGENIFLVNTIDNKYRFANTTEEVPVEEIEVGFEEDEIEIPAKYVSEDVDIQVILTTGEEETVISDWKIQEVNRKEETDPDTFCAIFTSDAADDYKYAEDTLVVLQIKPSKACEDIMYTFKYTTKRAMGFPDVWNTYSSFERIFE